MADFTRGEPDRPLKKKHVEWWCKTIIEYAHLGHSLDSMLHTHYVLRSEWDAYVKKHKQLQKALEDAASRAKGAAFKDLHTSRHSTNPALMKVYLANVLGWTDKSEGLEDDKPPPQVTVVVQPSGNGKGGKPIPISQASGKTKGNGKGNGR